MTRPYSRNSATRDAGYRTRYPYADDSYEYLGHDDDHDDPDTAAEPAYGYEYPADYHDELDRRWIWVAGVAGVILMVAVICTGIILGGGDSGSVSATQATTSAVATTSAAPSTTAVPVPPPVTAQNPALAPETVTTVTPTPSATATAPPPPTTEAQVPPVAPPAAAPDPAAAARTITYTVYGDKSLLDLVTIIYTDAQGALQTDVNVALPWRKTIALDPGVQLSSVTATSVTSRLNCSITDAAGAPLVAQANNTMIATCTR
ncbi:MmpS3 protein [Mycolicibacterium canariasense]|uniref:MmpS3 protein n=1 Tax=Mycolicibacterium canariasense TaxID=228230 RepID=A0A100W7L1_MYCCR|nr:hypothetical protein [Mycolicibacterium canariasense]MCV7211018.1 hypothetical protein [Mycolicibacterium canariasense]ORV01431.1 hypothetical protein AWB94_26145 [Mycolicibacterium canariasense]GAS93102.1 MmpS3 protein [Mycolicibacterium canariasense]